MMSFEVYKITNEINGFAYVGITTRGIHQRFREHINDAFNPNSKTYNDPLKKAIREFGKENFSIMSLDNSSESIEELAKLETDYIIKLETHVRYGHGYNDTFGGELGNPGMKGKRGRKHGESKQCVSVMNGEFEQEFESYALAGEYFDFSRCYANMVVDSHGEIKTSDGHQLFQAFQETITIVKRYYIDENGEKHYYYEEESIDDSYERDTKKTPHRAS